MVERRSCHGWGRRGGEGAVSRGAEGGGGAISRGVEGGSNAAARGRGSAPPAHVPPPRPNCPAERAAKIAPPAFPAAGSTAVCGMPAPTEAAPHSGGSNSYGWPCCCLIPPIAPLGPATSCAHRLGVCAGVRPRRENQKSGRGGNAIGPPPGQRQHANGRPLGLLRGRRGCWGGREGAVGANR